MNENNQDQLLGGRCWKGYEPTPGVKAYAKGSCRLKAGKRKRSTTVENEIRLVIKFNDWNAKSHKEKMEFFDSGPIKVNGRKVTEVERDALKIYYTNPKTWSQLVSKEQDAWLKGHVQTGYNPINPGIINPLLEVDTRARKKRRMLGNKSFGKKKRKVRRRFGSLSDQERWQKQRDDKQKQTDAEAMEIMKEVGIKYGLPLALGGVGYLGYKAYKGRKPSKRRRRKRKSSFGKKAKKPSAALRRLCKKHKVRLTVKRGKKRVYKSEKVLKKQCKTAMKKK